MREEHTHTHINNQKIKIIFEHEPFWNEEEAQQKKRVNEEIDQMDRRWKWIFRVKCE